MTDQGLKYINENDKPNHSRPDVRPIPQIQNRQSKIQNGLSHEDRHLIYGALAAIRLNANPESEEYRRADQVIGQLLTRAEMVVGLRCPKCGESLGTNDTNYTNGSFRKKMITKGGSDD